VEIPITVQEMAQYFGFDHFNWVSTISIPSTWHAFSQSHPLDLPNPRVDPSNETVYLLSPGVTQPVSVAPTGDGSGFYWNENPPQWISYFKRPDYSKPYPNKGLIDQPFNPYFFSFTDRPTYPGALFGPDDQVSFHTYLVGVEADGTIAPGDWQHFATTYGTGFTWHTNGKGDNTSVAYEKTLDSAGLPAITSGGVFGVMADNLAPPVPEPSSIVLVGIAVLAWGGIVLSRRG
jgi:hypothetical protein